MEKFLVLSQDGQIFSTSDVEEISSFMLGKSSLFWSIYKNISWHGGDVRVLQKILEEK